jgi:hypothetical protein
MKKELTLAISILLGIHASGQNTGIGVATPTNALHVVAPSNPLRLEGLQGGTDTDSVLTITNTGVVRRRAIAIASPGWSVAGNGSINPAINFVGTLNNVPLVFRTNNLASGFIEPDNTKRNTALGHGALASASITGSGNSALGYMAMRNVLGGSANVAIGDSALFANGAGSSNIAIGANALEANLASENIGIGNSALISNLNGGNNIGIGTLALRTNVSGLNNLAIGTEALRNATATDNIAIGYRAAFATTTGQQNIVLGNYAMGVNPGGGNNTYVGYQVAQLQTSGNSNTFIGFLSGGNFLGGSNNTMIGSGADVLNPNSTFSNSTALGSGAIIDRSNMVRLGNTTITRLESAVSLTTPSDGRVKKDIQENIPGLAFISKLRPVSYFYDMQKMDELTGTNSKLVPLAVYHEKERIRYSGFVAQEVYEAARLLGYDFSGVSAPANNKGLYGLAYAEMVVPLVKSVQELLAIVEKQQAQIDRLQQQIGANRQTGAETKN